MTTELQQLAAKANSDAKQGRNPSAEYLKVVNSKKKRSAKAVADARLLGLVERVLYGPNS